MTKRQARQRVAFFAYGVVDSRLSTAEYLYSEDASQAGMDRIDAALEDLLMDLLKRMGPAADHIGK
jgi:hypothetical protein